MMGSLTDDALQVPEKFREQFQAYHSNLTYHSTLDPGDPDKNKGARVPKKWRAQLNLLFAIGAKHSHLIGAEWAGAERDDIMYMLRAIYLLGLKDSVMFVSEPTIETVQAVGEPRSLFCIWVTRPHKLTNIADRDASALLPRHRLC
jgi:hypothetical protein